MAWQGGSLCKLKAASQQSCLRFPLQWEYWVGHGEQGEQRGYGLATGMVTNRGKGSLFTGCSAYKLLFALHRRFDVTLDRHVSECFISSGFIYLVGNEGEILSDDSDAKIVIYYLSIFNILLLSLWLEGLQLAWVHY